MKQVLTVLCLLITCLVMAQKSDFKTDRRARYIVPQPVSQKFQIENPDAQPAWRKVGEYYEARFIDRTNNSGHITVYDAAGNIIRKERELDRGDYPESVQTYLDRQFASEGYALWASTDSAGITTFYCPKGNSPILFDKDGKLLRGVADSVQTNRR